MWLFRKHKYATDEELVAAYKKTRDKKLFGELFEKHVRLVYGTCLYYFKDKEKAKDATMQLFEKLMHELLIKEVFHFQGWLSYVVRNHCINILRKEQQLEHRCLRDHFEFLQPDETEEQLLEKTKIDLYLEQLPGLITKLNEPQRVCVELFYLSGWSYQDISNKTGYSLNEVKSYIQNGKRNLKLMLLKQHEEKAA